jgi:putative phage-type endonuclease
MIQGSPEWFAARCGRATASRIADLMAKTKSGYSTSRANYMAELVAERLTGQPYEGYVNGDMQRGTELEPEARAAYEFLTGNTVVLAEFVPHPEIALSGASPDGYAGEDGLVEIKCPKTATHIDYLLTKTVPDKYILQMQWQMACTGRKWCDFWSYDPRLPERLQTFIKRIDRDDKRIAEISGEVIKFLAELDEMVKRLDAV